MKTSWLYQQIPAGKIRRHPKAQRKANLAGWKNRVGAWDDTKADVLRVRPDGKGGFLALDGAHRAEAAQEQFGPRFMLRCLVIPVVANGNVAEDAKVFDYLNNPDRRLPVPFSETHRNSLKFKDPEAVTVEAVLQDVPDAKATRTLYMVLRRHSEEALRRTGKALSAIWPDAEQFPAPVISGLARFLVDGGDVTRLRASRTLRRNGPRELWRKAQQRQSRHGGHGSLAEHVYALLKQV